MIIVKQILEDFLTSHGWNPEIAWGSTHATDIEAKRDGKQWIIEVGAAKSANTTVINAFVSVLGKILQRMHDPNYRYSIALPDTRPFRRLWARLPPLIKERTGITVLFVNPAGGVSEVSK